MKKHTDPSLDSSPTISARIWRVGLLVTTIAMGILLVALGVVEFRAAKKSGVRATQAQVMYMMLGFQKQFRKRQEPNAALTESLFEMLKEQAVHRVALYEGQTFLHGFGNAHVPLDPRRFLPPHPPKTPVPSPPVQILFITKNLIHAKVSLPGRISPPNHRMNWPRQQHRVDNRRSLLMELVPKEAITLRERAFRLMILDIVAALVLMGAAIIFWKQSLRQEQLQKQLEKDHQLKMLGQMSAVLGHELKNTIASIKGHSQLLAERLMDSPHHSNAALIAKDAIYLQTLTEQMLDFSRTGAMRTEKVYLDDLIEAAITFSIAHNVKTELRVDRPFVFIDRQKIQQVLTNLLNNAQQANAQNISLSVSTAQNDAIIIHIKDDGDGIVPGELEKIFDPFFTHRAKGTGLGLALSKQIIKAHGGSVSVRSTPKQETIFTIEIPAHQQTPCSLTETSQHEESK